MAFSWSMADWMFCFCQFVVERLVRLLGPLFITAGVSIIGFVSVVHFLSTVPYYGGYGSVAGAAHSAVGALLVAHIFFNYFMAIFVEPGEPPRPMSERERALAERLAAAPAPTRGRGFARYCKRCQVVKPARTHHCHICKRCVLKMDHHCPWIGGCVGHLNHRYFVLFMWWLFVGCCYVQAAMYDAFVADGLGYPPPWRGARTRAIVSFCFVIALAIACAVGILLFWHLYLAATAQTTIEFYFNRSMRAEAAKRNRSWRNPFDCGVRKNWQFFFGVENSSLWWLTWMIMSSSSSPGNGVDWPTSRSVELSLDGDDAASTSASTSDALV